MLVWGPGCPLYSSPLLVSVQPQVTGTPDKIRMCKDLSKSAKSVASVNFHSTWVNREAVL